MFALDISLLEPDKQKKKKKSKWELGDTVEPVSLLICWSLQARQRSWLAEQSSYNQVKTQSCGCSSFLTFSMILYVWSESHMFKTSDPLSDLCVATEQRNKYVSCKYPLPIEMYFHKNYRFLLYVTKRIRNAGWRPTKSKLSLIVSHSTFSS